MFPDKKQHWYRKLAFGKLSTTFNTLTALSHNQEHAKETLTIKSAHWAFGSLRWVFNNHGLALWTKLMVLCVISSLLYACETWTLYWKDQKKLVRFQAKLQQITNIRWQERRTNNKVLNRSEMPNTEAAILKHCLICG